MIDRDPTGLASRGGVPIAVMALATFLVVFALMVARLPAGAGPALRASAGPGAPGEREGAGAPAVRTRTSGGEVAAGATEPAFGPRAAAAPALTTRTSGRVGAAGMSDD